MSLSFPSSRLAEALARAGRHGLENRPGPGSARSPFSPATPLSIAFSRQVGAHGTLVAREVGKILGWPVYDQELLRQVARQMHVASDRVARVDEKPVSWLLECLQSLSSAPDVTEEGYVGHLMETLFLLGAQGKCVIVGRGAAHALPALTTLRVRLIAPLEHRIETMGRILGVSRKEAERLVETTERERVQFIRSHFVTDPTDPLNYDLVLNSARLTVAECAGLVVEALKKMETRQPTPRARYD
jgi:cytidylate kinase